MGFSNDLPPAPVPAVSNRKQRTDNESVDEMIRQRRAQVSSAMMNIKTSPLGVLDAANSLTNKKVL